MLRKVECYKNYSHCLCFLQEFLKAVEELCLGPNNSNIGMKTFVYRK